MNAKTPVGVREGSSLIVDSLEGKLRRVMGPLTKLVRVLGKVLFLVSEIEHTWAT